MANADADNIFQLYQQQASTGELKLRRYPLRNVSYINQMLLHDLTNHAA
jgi:hypothetical protein